MGQKAHNTKILNSPPPPHVPCISQLLKTFNLYSGGPRMGLQVNNMQMVRQAMVRI